MGKISNYTIDVLNTLSCENVAKKLGVEVIKHRALCFMHDDHHPSLYFFGKIGKSGGVLSAIKEEKP